MKEFHANVIGKLEEKLVDKQYLTGWKITMVDIMCYVELQTILTLYRKKINKDEHGNVLKWFDALSEEETI